MDERIALFYDVLTNKDFSEDKMMLIHSTISNKIININKSLADNINNLNLDSSKYPIDTPLFSTPLYRLMLSYAAFYPMLIQSYKKNLLDEVTAKDIIETIIMAIEQVDASSLQNTLLFLKNFISVKRVNSSIFKQSPVICAFVCQYDKYIVNTSRKAKNYDMMFFTRIIIMSMLSYGYIDFNYPDLVYPEASEFGEVRILKPLLEQRNYTYANVILSNKVLSSCHHEALYNVLTEVMGSRPLTDDDYRFLTMLLPKMQIAGLNHYADKLYACLFKNNTNWSYRLNISF